MVTHTMSIRRATSLSTEPLLPFLYPTTFPFCIAFSLSQHRLASTGPQYQKQQPNKRPTKAEIYQRPKQQPPAYRQKPPKPPPSPLYPPVISRPAKPGELPLLPYHIHRTASQQLPIYNQAKRGGNLHQTLIRKIEGDVDILRRDLIDSLSVTEKEVVINRLTGHVVVKVRTNDGTVIVEHYAEERHELTQAS